MRGVTSGFEVTHAHTSNAAARRHTGDQFAPGNEVTYLIFTSGNEVTN